MDLSNFKEFKDGANQIIDDLAQTLNTQDQLADLITACDKQIDELVAKRDGYRNEMVEVCEQFEHLISVLEGLPKIIKNKLGMVDETDDDDDLDDDEEDLDDEVDDDDEEVEDDEVEPDGTL